MLTIARVVTAVTLVLLIALLLLAIRERGLEARDRIAFPPRGRLVDIGGRSIHLYCTGSARGTPMVLLDSGMGGWSELWPYQQAPLSRKTRVCSYDRAGFGWSDPGPEPRTVDALARDLHATLVKAGEPRPFVFAGASFGGLIARMYAHLYPKDIAGMVLIDPSHEDALKRLPPIYAATERAPRSWWRAHAPLWSELGISRIFASPPPSFLPADRRKAIAAAALQPKQLEAQIAEEKAWPESDKMMHSVGRLGDIPLLVLSASEGGSPELLRARHQLHSELASLSTRGRMRILPIAHASYITDPADGALVAQAIQEVVAEASSPSTPSAVSQKEKSQ